MMSGWLRCVPHDWFRSLCEAPRHELSSRRTADESLHGEYLRGCLRGDRIFTNHADWPAMELTYRLTLDDWRKFNTTWHERGSYRRRRSGKQVAGALPVPLILL